MDRRTLLRRGTALLPFLAGCTGSPSDATTDSPTASPTDQPTDSPTASPSATETPTETATPTPAENPAQTVVVAPDGKLRFDPESFTIATGETVVWEWASGGHNVSPGSQPEGADWPGKDETTYAAGTTHQYTFTVAGTYEYHCDPHQSVGMVGSFTVE